MSNEVIEGNYAVVGGGGDNIPTVQLEPEYESGERESLAKFSLKAYLAYAMSVVKGRALPRIEDGQKPVQSRILYAMHRMGIDEKTKPVKSARVVGDVIGKLHPHGDSSVYDAMVRMAQGFVLRYPLVHGQGNWGSRDGDTAAAMRYTEARLTNYANLLLAELDLGTVDFVPNYDGEFQEPSVLPARLPMLLLNGASGIAVGMATEVPSHNLTEIAQACEFVIQNPDATLRDIMEIIPAPDFPGGAQIISTREEIAKAYSGRGSIRVRARWVVEPLARNQWQIVVTELPPGASTKSVMTQIESIINPQIKKGQKTLTQEQLAQKALVLSVLDGMRDDSDDENPIRIIFEPPTAKVSADEMMQVLLAHTDLEKNVAMNLVSIGRDGRPKQKNLVQMIKEWIDFRYVTVTRRTQHRLNEVEARIHILEGRMIAFLHIDEVIRVIRDSESPKEDLMQRFGLSETQAEDILEIRLRQLAKLEGIKIERELADLKVEAEKLRHLLANRPAMTKLILSEIQADTKKYGDDRRTLIEAAQKVTLGAVAPATDDPVTVIVSKQGWLRARAGHGIDLNSVAFKAGDELWCSFECQSSQTLVFIGTSGRCYNIGVSLLPNGRSDGAPLTSFIDLQPGCRPVQAFIATPGKKRLFCTSAGYGYIACSEDLLTRQKAGKAFITISDAETVLPPSEILGDRVYALSSGGRMLSFPVSEMKEMPKGKGVMIMDFNEKESLLACVVSGDAVSLTDNHGASAVYSGADLDKFKLHRARKGCQTPGKSKFVNLSPVAV